MNLSEKKEDFSYAYIRAVAAAAGFAVEAPMRDNASIDLEIHGKGFDSGKVCFPQAGLQVKCTATASVPSDAIKYKLKLKNYNDLRPENVSVPRFLVVVLVPEDEALWLGQSEEEMIIRQCAYLVSLRGLPDTDNETSVTVTLPTENILSIDSLTQLMHRISSGDMK